MDLKDSLFQIIERIKKANDTVQTEEATKMSFIVPFIASLGYDVYNPLEVIPEYTCDAPGKNGEKVDYAISIDGKTKILVECKHCGVNLEPHDKQLFRYFTTSSARFAILTNGIEYKFYTDIDNKNIMDDKPFLVINMLDLKDADIAQIKKFHKSYFDENSILSSANELRYTTSIKALLNEEFQNPSVGLVTYIAKQVYDGKVGQKIIDQFTPMVKSSISGIIVDMISERLAKASKSEEELPKVDERPEELPEGVVNITEDGVITTQDELDSYMIIKNICRQICPEVTRLIFKDYKSYATISVDKEYQWFVRLYMGTGRSKLYISFFDAKSGKGEYDKTQIVSLDEIYNYSDKIIESLKAVMK